MLSEKSYAHVLKTDARINPRSNPIGMLTAEFQDLMLRLTGDHWNCTMRGYMHALRSLAFSLAPGCYCIIIRHVRERYGHYIVVERDNAATIIYDPEMPKPLSVADYERGAWKVVRVFVRDEA